MFVVAALLVLLCLWCGFWLLCVLDWFVLGASLWFGVWFWSFVFGIFVRCLVVVAGECCWWILLIVLYCVFLVFMSSSGVNLWGYL